MCVQIREEFRAMGQANNKLQDVWPVLKFKILNLAQQRNLSSLLEAVTDDLNEGVLC